MGPKEYLDVLIDMGKVKQEPFIPITNGQKMTLAILFREFADLADLEREFAIVGDSAKWFRKKCLGLIFNKTSMTELTIGQASMLIDEFGTKFGGVWQLKDTGKQAMYTLLDLIAEDIPRQKGMEL